MNTGRRILYLAMTVIHDSAPAADTYRFGGRRASHP